MQSSSQNNNSPNPGERSVLEEEKAVSSLPIEIGIEQWHRRFNDILISSEEGKLAAVEKEIRSSEFQLLSQEIKLAILNTEFKVPTQEEKDGEGSSEKREGGSEEKEENADTEKKQAKEEPFSLVRIIAGFKPSVGRDSFLFWLFSQDLIDYENGNAVAVLMVALEEKDNRPKSPKAEEKQTPSSASLKDEEVVEDKGKEKVDEEKEEYTQQEQAYKSRAEHYANVLWISRGLTTGIYLSNAIDVEVILQYVRDTDVSSLITKLGLTELFQLSAQEKSDGMTIERKINAALFEKKPRAALRKLFLLALFDKEPNIAFIALIYQEVFSILSLDEVNSELRSIPDEDKPERCVNIITTHFAKTLQEAKSNPCCFNLLQVIFCMKCRELDFHSKDYWHGSVNNRAFKQCSKLAMSAVRDSETPQALKGIILMCFGCLANQDVKLIPHNLRQCYKDISALILEYKKDVVFAKWVAHGRSLQEGIQRIEAEEQAEAQRQKRERRFFLSGSALISLGLSYMTYRVMAAGTSNMAPIKARLITSLYSAMTIMNVTAACVVLGKLLVCPHALRYYSTEYDQLLWALPVCSATALASVLLLTKTRHTLRILPSFALGAYSLIATGADLFMAREIQ